MFFQQTQRTRPGDSTFNPASIASSVDGDPRPSSPAEAVNNGPLSPQVRSESDAFETRDDWKSWPLYPGPRSSPQAGDSGERSGSFRASSPGEPRKEGATKICTLPE